MELSIIKEAGYEEALVGMAFSFIPEGPLKSNPKEPTEKMIKQAELLCKHDGGHNKFLESIIVWVDIRASLKVWKQIDTYRLCTKQSKSTMHTSLKKYLTWKDFDAPVDSEVLCSLNRCIEDSSFEKLCNDLPSSFLQTRRVCLSYKTIRNMVNQRIEHRLSEWQEICSFFLNNLEHPELLGISLRN